jgi:hypothetical protein
LRNSVGHAVGREIEASRVHGVKELIPMKKISRTKTFQYLALISSVAKAIDKQLLVKNIGEYQAIHFYHRLFPKLRKDFHPNQRAIIFKKEIGKFGAQSPGKEFCFGLVKYYEDL